jgi:hypothetical protein
MRWYRSANIIAHHNLVLDGLVLESLWSGSNLLTRSSFEGRSVRLLSSLLCSCSLPCTSAL